MKIKSTVIFYWIVIMTFSLNAFAQVIDYSTWTSPSQCNVFYPTTSVNGALHTTTTGQPQHTNIKHFLFLPCRQENTFTYKGSEYKIAYNFLSGYNYTITVNASCQASTFSTLRVDFTSEASGGGTSCTGPEAVAGTSALNAYNNYGMNPGAYFDYNFVMPTTTSAKSYLYVGSFYWNAPSRTADSYVSIKKITITGTPAIVFNLTPANVNKTCNVALSQTFTVVNQNNTPGVTGYTWNLGATPNRWYYNGNPAPATLTTATNTLTLTANPCDQPPANISAAAIIGANSFPTNQSVVNGINPSLTITGPNELCSGTAVYTVSGIPCNGTVTWSAEPAGLVTLTPNGNQVTLGYVTNGNLVLNATVSLSCSASPVAATPKEIPIGTPVAWNFPISGPPTLCYNQNGFYTTPFYNGVTYNWTAVNFSPGGGPGPTFSGMPLPFSGAGQLILNISNACGNASNPPIMFVNFMNCFNSYTVSPNPAKNNVLIKAQQASLSKEPNTKIAPPALIYGVKIVDNTGQVRRIADYKAGIDQVNFPIENIPAGIYTLSVFNGKTWESHKLVVQ